MGYMEMITTFRNILKRLCGKSYGVFQKFLTFISFHCCLYHTIIMHCHACYRLFAAIDLVVAAFTGLLWWIVYRREEALIRLQVEEQQEQDPIDIDINSNVTFFLNRVRYYRVLIRSIGNGHDATASADILRDIYLRVRENCEKYYARMNISYPTGEMGEVEKGDLMHTLKLCTTLILVSIGIFMLADLLVLISTRKGKASSSRMISFVFILYLFSFVQYLGGALELRLDPKFCCPESELRPMVLVLLVICALCKPLQIYVTCHFYHDVRTGAYLDNELIIPYPSTIRRQGENDPEDIRNLPRPPPPPKKKPGEMVSSGSTRKNVIKDENENPLPKEGKDEESMDVERRFNCMNIPKGQMM